MSRVKIFWFPGRYKIVILVAAWLIRFQSSFFICLSETIFEYDFAHRNIKLMSSI